MNETSQEEYACLYDNGVIWNWYLKESQKELYKMLRSKKRVISNCHRRFGKGTTILTYVFERMLTEKIIVRYGAPTQNQAYDILSILIEHIFIHCPSKAPKLVGGQYVTPNGSVMHVFGVKDRAELDKGRGTEAHIIVADEYGFWRYKPSYALRSVLSPQLDDTDGQLIIASTPPEDLTHPFITEELRSGETDGSLFYWDIEKSLAIGDISPRKHAKIIERCGGTDSDSYKREYELDLVSNRSRLVIPEAQHEKLYVKDYEVPDFKDCYVCFDLGFKDYTFGVFGYYDFKTAQLVIIDELALNYSSTSHIAAEAKRVEEEHSIKDPMRFADSSDPQQIYDMCHDHSYNISPILKRSKMTGKGFQESVINGLRIAIGNEGIIIDKRCKNLIAHIKYGIWNERRTDFERTESLGHLDGLMALAYLKDNVDVTKNPYPLRDPKVSEASHFVPASFYDPEPRKKDLTKLIGR